MEISGLEPEAFSLLTKRDTSYTMNPTEIYDILLNKFSQFITMLKSSKN